MISVLLHIQIFLPPPTHILCPVWYLAIPYMFAYTVYVYVHVYVFVCIHVLYSYCYVYCTRIVRTHSHTVCECTVCKSVRLSVVCLCVCACLCTLVSTKLRNMYIHIHRFMFSKVLNNLKSVYFKIPGFVPYAITADNKILIDLGKVKWIMMYSHCQETVFKGVGWNSVIDNRLKKLNMRPPSTMRIIPPTY